MDKLQKYRKIRSRLERGAGAIAIIIGMAISSYLGIWGKEFISVDTALSLAIMVGISIVLNNLAIKIADKWYKKNENE